MPHTVLAAGHNKFADLQRKYGLPAMPLIRGGIIQGQIEVQVENHVLRPELAGLRGILHTPA